MCERERQSEREEGLPIYLHVEIIPARAINQKTTNRAAVTTVAALRVIPCQLAPTTLRAKQRASESETEREREREKGVSVR